MTDAILWGEYLDTIILTEQKAKLESGEMKQQTYSATKSRMKKKLQLLEAEQVKFLKWRNVAMTKAPPTAEQLFIYKMYASSESHIKALKTIQRYTRGYVIRKNMDASRPARTPQYLLARMLYFGECHNAELIIQLARDINSNYGCRHQRIDMNGQLSFYYPNEDAEEVYNKTAQTLLPHLALFNKALLAKKVFRTFYNGDRY